MHARLLKALSLQVFTRLSAAIQRLRAEAAELQRAADDEVARLVEREALPPAVESSGLHKDTLTDPGVAARASRRLVLPARSATHATALPSPPAPPATSACCCLGGRKDCMCLLEEGTSGMEPWKPERSLRRNAQVLL